MKKFLPWLLSVVLMTIILTLTVSIDIPVGNSGRPATFYIGSTLTPWPASASVDYQCDGVDDHIQIQQALDALPVNGGKIVIYAGNYKLGASISRAIDNIVIEGVGAGTYLSNNGVTNIFNVGIQKKWVFKDIRVDNGGISVATASEWSFDNVWIGLGYVAKRSDFTTTQNQDMANKSYVDGAISAIPPSLGNVTGGGLANRIVKWVNSTSIGDASNTDAQVADSVGKAHMQGTDTSLGVQISDINMGGHSVTNVTLVDGVDVSSLTLGNITGSGITDRVVKWVTSSIVTNTTYTSTQVNSAISSSHTQGTDTTLGPLITALNMNGNLITNGVTPVSASDIATKGYVDSAIVSNTISYGDEIAQGNVANTSSWSKIGYNADIGLTQEDMWPQSVSFRFLSSASKLQIISDSASDTSAGIGARNVTITYLDTNYTEKSETVTLNGTTAVNTTNTDYYRVQNLRTWGVGDNGAPVGTLLLRMATNTTHVLTLISSGENRARNVFWTVPAGKTLYITTVTGTSASGSKQATVRVTTKATYDNQNSRYGLPGLQFFGYTEMYLQDNTIVLPLNPPTKIPEKTDIRVTCISDAAGAKATLSLRGYVTTP